MAREKAENPLCKIGTNEFFTVFSKKNEIYRSDEEKYCIKTRGFNKFYSVNMKNKGVDTV